MTLERYKATIVEHVAQKSWRWIPKWVDDMIAAKVISGLAETLREMLDPDHPWRDGANTLIENWIDDLAHDPEMWVQGEALKREILANPVFAEQAQALREELETALRDDLPRHAEAIVRWLAASASALGQWLEEDAARRAGEDQQAAQAPGAAYRPASPGRNRRLYRGGGRQPRR